MDIRDRLRIVDAIPLGVSLLAIAVLLGVTSAQVVRLSLSVDELRQDVAFMKRQQELRAAEAERPVSPLLLDYELELPGRGEVFPAMAATRAPEYWPIAVLRATNTSNRAVAQTVTAEIPGWSLRTEQSLVLAARESRNVPIQPELLPRAFANDELRRASLEVRVYGPDAGILFVREQPVMIHGGAEIYWGRRFANAQVTARWVTPHDPSVLELVSRARRHAPGGRLAGYRGGATPAAVEAHVRDQARAVFRALQESGLTYVNSLYVMGEHVNDAQRIRLPRETLRLANANCMDVSVAFASAMENLGLQPFVVIVPGHAFAGVRLRPDTDRVLDLDLTVLPKGSFQAAADRAQRWRKRTRPEEQLIVDISAARALGIYPLAERTAAVAELERGEAPDEVD